MRFSLKSLGHGIVALLLPVSAALAQGNDLKAICGECEVEKFTNCGDAFLEGPAFDESGRLWLVSLAKGDIHRVTPEGQCSIVGNTGGEPQSLKYAGDNRLLGVDRRIGVFAVDTQTAEITRIADRYYSKNFNGLNDLVLDKNGGVYFTDAYGSSILQPIGAVYYLPPKPKKGDRVTKVFENLAFPNGIAFTPNGKRLLVSETSARRVVSVEIVDPGVASPELVRIAAVLPFGGPDGLAVDADGNVFVAAYNAAQVGVYNAAGAQVGAIDLPPEAGIGVTNMAFHEGYLYVTEGLKGDVWRVELTGAK